METDLTIRCVKDRLHGHHVRDACPGFETHDRCVCAVDQLAHLGKTQSLATSPLVKFHVPYVRLAHIVVNMICAGGVQ